MNAEQAQLEKNINVDDIQFILELHPKGDKIMNPVILRGDIWEPMETAVFIQLAKSSNVIFDIGANIGWYSIIASKLVGSNGVVIAFEPQAEIANILSRNITRNEGHNIQIMRMAVSDVDASAPFVTTVDHVGDHHLANVSAGETGNLVPVTSIDTQCRRINKNVDLIKVDTQGAEVSVFRGLISQLKSGMPKPILISEFWPHGIKRFGGDPISYLDALESHEYSAYLIDQHALRPITMKELRHRVKTDLAPIDREFVDLVLMPHGDHREDLIAPFIEEYTVIERIWRFWVRPMLARYRRNIRRRTKI